MRDAGDVEDWILAFQRIEARVVAERPFCAELVQIHVSLQNDLRVCGNLQAAGCAGHHLHRLAPQESRKHHLVKIWRNGEHARQAGDWVGANRRRDFNLSFPGLRPRAAKMVGAMFLRLPVHGGGALIKHLHAIHADVALARLRVLGDHKRPGDEPPGVLRPAFQDGKLEKRKALFADHFLARRDLRRRRNPAERAKLRKIRQHLQLVQQTLRGLKI